ncbi:hypothetical protein MMC08_003464 [Hypocenomyce scalaris]|nr:hypothetical protein [Hypocenomyce scalaris]
MLVAGEAAESAAPIRPPSESHDPPMWVEIVAVGCLMWYVFILTVISIGFVQLRRHYSSIPSKAVSPTLLISRVPHVTILRPVKGLEPHLYECLAATFHQTYPRSKLTIYFCISSRDDPAFPILQQLLADFPNYDAKVLVEEEDPNLSGRDGRECNLGPNPKIRNMSRGYREAKGDIIWVIDCNVWISHGVAGRMVDRLCGFNPGSHGRKYKFVHQLPLVIDVPPEPHPSTTSFHSISSTSTASTSLISYNQPLSSTQRILTKAGGRLEEMFQATTHAKFYTGINTAAVAPCIVGKSNMFRRSHLNALTSTSSTRSPGIDFFSDNICEDHLIGDLLWKSPIPESVLFSAQLEGRSADNEEDGDGWEGSGSRSGKWGKHALLPGDLAIQPTSTLPLSQYIARRIRWLRVRKFTVTLATLIEPGVESLLCSLYGSFALTTLPWCHSTLHIPQTWSAFWTIWIMNIIAWVCVDWLVFRRLQSGATVEKDENTPAFVARPLKRGWREWAAAWVGREVLAGPIWAVAFWGGVGVMWRGRRFWVGTDMKVHEIGGGEEVKANGHGGGGKARRD